MNYHNTVLSINNNTKKIFFSIFDMYLKKKRIYSSSSSVALHTFLGTNK